MTKKTNQITISTEGYELSDVQKRLIRSLNTLMLHSITTDDESEYFESCAELMRVCANLIKGSEFSQVNKDSSIPYSQQAIEFSIDVLTEHMDQDTVCRYDN